MSKVDFKKKLKHLYNPPKSKFTIVDVPAMNFLMIDGHGDPNNNPAFQDISDALYGMAYTIAQMHAFIEAEGYEPHGKHHEIYLSDPRRTAPEKLKTVIRQPIREATP